MEGNSAGKKAGTRQLQEDQGFPLYRLQLESVAALQNKAMPGPAADWQTLIPFQASHQPSASQRGEESEPVQPLFHPTVDINLLHLGFLIIVSGSECGGVR